MISPIQVTEKMISQNLKHWNKPKYKIAKHHYSNLNKDRNIVAVFHIYPTVTGQRQRRYNGSLFIAITARLENPHLLRNFPWSNVPVDFFEFLSTKFAACSKPPSRDNHRKASYPRTQQRDQGAG